MNNTTLIIGIVVLVFVFLLTYDPKTRRLEKYLEKPSQVAETGGPKCESDRYHELQFNSKSNGEGCMGEQLQYKGAII
jgi:hypothetical protein